ncbi:hypothetical protein QOL99_00100 [Deinococcus sp. MIMF12]|uniref:Uncharacterized protein n=1 Tax=Deinococcus rhizophilus TaxID=3049544 RepID=A0ABT7JBX5_9DEIO|nr:hypothetical protein [Deinococcus rhizophilus]MDL2342549.1 hypothetical protein [Deinococcus rhizophilus]
MIPDWLARLLGWHTQPTPPAAPRTPGAAQPGPHPYAVAEPQADGTVIVRIRPGQGDAHVRHARPDSTYGPDLGGKHGQILSTMTGQVSIRVTPLTGSVLEAKDDQGIWLPFYRH